MHLLFEKRLGMEMYRPIGKEWFTNGFWRVAEPYGNAEDTIGQYLAIDSRKWDSQKRLNGDYKLKDGVYYIYDPENKMHHKAITFDKFREMQFDYVCSTHPLHDIWQLLLQYQPKAKWIAQIGNEGQTTMAPTVISSVYNYQPISGQKVLFAHQEFDLSDYGYIPPTSHTKISSFVVLLPEREVFLQYKNALPEMDMKAYGPGAIDGNIGDVKGISGEMKASAFGWHIKSQDGYGHVLHKWFAVGRPVIIRGSYYEGKTGGLLLEDQVTCIDLDKHSFEENLKLIRYWAEPENHIKMCQNGYKKFKEVVDFDREAEEIIQYLKGI